MSESTNNAANGPAADPDAPISVRGFRREKKVEIEFEPGIPKRFVVREMLGADRQKWQKRQRARYGTDFQGQPAGVAEFEGMEADLISCCLFDENNRAVPASTVNGWGSSVQSFLYQLCLAINAISEKDQEKLKVV